jgi:restriction endonuclease Mrr
MRERRVDRIGRVLRKMKGRARVREVLRELRRIEQNASLTNSSVYVAIKAENERLESSGERPRFRTSKQGEQWGWVSLESESGFAAGSTAAAIERQILEANRGVDAQIRDKLRSMDWRTFESGFLSEVLEKLGFQDVEITQPTRDGGTDARVSYKRGLVEARAIVSAKRWSARTSVPVDEVRLMRGIKGDEDTAIIITTASFTPDAQREARPSQNQRVVYLIDGDRLVDICKRHRIGINPVPMPELLTLDEESFVFDDAAPEPRPTEGHRGAEVLPGLHRFRDNMLYEIGSKKLSSLLGLSENTVRVYLSIPERRRAMAEAVRGDDKKRAKALALVESERRSRA